MLFGVFFHIIQTKRFQTFYYLLVSTSTLDNAVSYILFVSVHRFLFFFFVISNCLVLCSIIARCGTMCGMMIAVQR
ncbi:uncharacterized protein B0T23DRAFT_373945 [Neurospora hispaniola]|uniref:Uncharacterized protein n=1 Tax=Neurospora hispaniola TaxID=588809 RepID=A0AAJ0ICP2_9PEZI|nr:hypothetical protein B0T23DRAFT_373945 [Neurospora hispaniola]